MIFQINSTPLLFPPFIRGDLKGLRKVINIYLTILCIFFSFSTLIAQFPEKDLPFDCGNNEFTEIPEQAQHFVEMDGERDQQYNIGLAFQIIYGEYALTDITLHLTINEHYENAGILLYDMFTKH